MRLVQKVVNGHTGFHDLGYRFFKSYWGKGYATEAAKAVVAYGFETMRLTVINGMANVDNMASQGVLMKVGLLYVNDFEFDGMMHKWYKATAPGVTG